MKKYHEEDLQAIQDTHVYLNNHTDCRAILIHRHFEPHGVAEPPVCMRCDNCTEQTVYNEDERNWSKFVLSDSQRQHVAQVLTDLSSEEAGELPTFTTLVNNIKVCPVAPGDVSITTAISEWIVDRLISSKVLSPHLNIKMWRTGAAQHGQTKIRTLGTGSATVHLKPSDCELHYTFNATTILQSRAVPNRMTPSTPATTTTTSTTLPTSTTTTTTAVPLTAARFVFKESWTPYFWVGRIKKPWNI